MKFIEKIKQKAKRIVQAIKDLITKKSDEGNLEMKIRQASQQTFVPTIAINTCALSAPDYLCRS